VFTELRSCLSGPVRGRVGTITGIFTVLVDGDDHEPIADAVRGILDSHIVMQRSIAERGRFPRLTAQVGFPHHAEISRPGLSADHHPGVR
jgi:flagellum-specific ATP synthase